MKSVENDLQSTINELGQTVKAVGKIFHQFPWNDKNHYSQWLAQTYYYVRHTTCFIALMAAHWGVKNRERQYQALGFLNGESAHDLLALDDLKHMGLSIKSFVELPETKVFYQNQYYFIEHVSPAAQLGYAFLLEGIASQEAARAYKIVAETHGEQAGRFLRIHSEEDVGHYEEGLKLLMGLTREELQAFRDSLRQSAMLYTQILNSIQKI
ncbi:MAG: iron-containing redox enzyme family protein [Bdellovibrionota bacterium]